MVATTFAADTPLAVTDDYWLAPPVPAVAPLATLHQQQDEAPRTIALPDDDRWLPVTAQVAPVLLLWEQQDERATPALPLGIDADPWPPLYHIRVHPLVWTGTHQDERLEAVVYEFTADSREHVTGRHERLTIERLGGELAGVHKGRIGTKRM